MLRLFDQLFQRHWQIYFRNTSSSCSVSCFTGRRRSVFSLQNSSVLAIHPCSSGIGLIRAFSSAPFFFSSNSSTIAFHVESPTRVLKTANPIGGTDPFSTIHKQANAGRSA